MIRTISRSASLRRLVAALLAALLVLAGAGSIYAVGPSDTITTVAGDGTEGYSGDGGPATAAQLTLGSAGFGSGAVALDAAGNLFIADSLNSVIRKVDTSGIITTVAGDGTFGYSGDGGPATAAQLAGPSGLALDAAGNLFIADGVNSVIRKVDTSGIITTVAGDGTLGYSGDGGPATAAQLAFVASASFLGGAVALDGSGNLFIADSVNSVIRKVDTSGIITTVAGDGTAGYAGDGGPAGAAQLNIPTGVVVEAAGNLFIADAGNSVIRKVDTSGIITTVAGDGTAGYAGDGGPATAAQLASPFGLALDAAGNLYIADSENNAIRKVDTSGIITTVAGDGTAGYAGDGGPAGAAQLNSPHGVAVDGAGSLFIADSLNNRVRRVGSAADTTAPTISITTPANGATYTLGQAVNASYSCQDEAGGSGLVSCAGPVPSGSPIDTSSVGAKTFTVNAADNAGNTSTLTHNYTVAYAFSGFFAPVDNLPTLNQVKAGQSIPVKFSLGGNQGLGILASGYPVSQQISCDGGAPVDVIEETTTANQGLTYGGGQYTYVWKTQKSWAGTCRQFILRLTDGTDHIALFKFK